MRLEVYGPPSTGEDDLQEAILAAREVSTLTYGGVVDSDTVIERCRGAILAFLSDYGEGMPRILMEAGTAGGAVVAFSTPLTHEALGDGCGVLVQDVVDVPGSPLATTCTKQSTA